MAGRRFLVGGNWKMNGSLSFLTQMTSTLSAVENVTDRDIVVGIPAVYLARARENLPKNIGVAAQNCYKTTKGAFTGEISADMVKDVNCEWVILGHSERRHVFGEADQLIADKVEYALSTGLKVIYCIGEKLEERESNETSNVLKRQMQSLIGKVAADKWDNVVIAYEPVWAIGTGKTATPEQASEAHIMIRDWIKTNINEDVAMNMRIIYGGSVSVDNCETLAKASDIDGFLVGGASLKPDFCKIVTVAN